MALPLQALRGLPCLGSFSVVQWVRHIDGPLHPRPQLRPYSVDQCIRHLKGRPGWGPTIEFRASGVWWASLSIVQQQMLAVRRDSGFGDGSTPTRDSAVSPCFHGCLAFLQRHFPQSPSPLLLDPSLYNHQKPSPRDCSTTAKLQLPAAGPSRGPASLSRVCMAAVSIVWFSFHLGLQRSAVSLSALNIFPLTRTIAPMWELDPCFSSPTCLGQVQSY